MEQSIPEFLARLGIRGWEKYAEEFRRSRIVLKFGGNILEQPEPRRYILDDVKRLCQLGLRPALVHGGSTQADRMMREAGIEPERYKGLRKTCGRTIEILEHCFAEVNRDLVRDLAQRDVPARGFTGREAGLIQAAKLAPDGVDIGFVGEVRSVRLDMISDAIPVVASLGVDADGCLYNINADYVATALAAALEADKLILVTDIDGIMQDVDDPDSLVSTLTRSQALTWIEDRTIGLGMIPKVQSLLDALQLGVGKVHIINGLRPHSLLFEILTDSGIGTQILPD